MKLVINRRKLEEARLENGFTVKMLAEKSGVSQSVISALINRNGIPRFGTIKKIADALGVNVLDIASVEEGYNETRKRPGPKRKTAVNE